MFSINEQYTKLPESYLFSEIARRVNTFKAENPSADVIRLGIGDVTRPIPPAVIEALHKAVEEMGSAATFKGYGPEQGYDFLRGAIVKYDFLPREVELEADEIFVSDGSKSDTGNITDILGRANKVAITDPVYPVYVDTNVMTGLAGELQADGKWSNIIYLPCNAENNFVPSLPAERPDVIYLCLPNNPTGMALTKDQLKVWVDYALENECLILFDAAYESFIQEDNIPHSIYEIEGAKKVAIEFRSFSKTAGFTGLRCGFTVVPKELTARLADGSTIPLNRLWNRRQCTKFNGTAYIIQRAAEAVYSIEGQKQVKDTINYYMENAQIIREGLTAQGYEVYGGINAPYIWLRVPKEYTSWEFFDHLLNTYHLVGTPGVGFGPCGEGYFRLTAFGDKEQTKEAVQRLSAK
ncbi:MAG: LL-diaminopimelate aminotransferase [Odoribacter sp.]|nr:LL-diaminopimelate aminotransferase [Odoribacter sp.]